MWIRVSIAVLGLSLGVAGCFSDSGGCERGALDCTCMADGQCLGNLMCLDSVCRGPSAGSSSSAGTTATVTGTTTSTSMSTTANATDSNPAAHVLFVTSIVFPNAAFGGTGGADSECMIAGADTAVDTTWQALVTEDDGPVQMRGLVTGPVVNVAADQIAPDPETLFSAPLQAPILDELSEQIAADFGVWVGAATMHCENWTTSQGTEMGQVGLVIDPVAWLDDGPQACNLPGRLYCISALTTDY